MAQKIIGLSAALAVLVAAQGCARGWPLELLRQ